MSIHTHMKTYKEWEHNQQEVVSTGALGSQLMTTVNKFAQDIQNIKMQMGPMWDMWKDRLERGLEKVRQLV